MQLIASRSASLSDEVIGEFEQRANNNHHTSSFGKGVDARHHVAFAAMDVGKLGRIADALSEAGKTILWGPGRHGTGDKVALYHLDLGSTIIDHYTNTQRITDDSWVARRLPLSPTSGGGPMPAPELFEAVTALAAPVAPLSR